LQDFKEVIIQVSKILEIKKVSKSFGGLQAISELDLTIDQGELLGLIGPNGSGKTTFFNLITGVYKPTNGHIIYRNKAITGLRPDQLCAKGIGRMFQHTVLFSGLTVFQNILVATHLRSKLNFWHALFNTPIYKERERKAEFRALEVIKFVGLESVRDELASNLPHGHQRSLGVAMALVTKPQLLLLDEPTTGMNREETESMMELVKKISNEGVTVLLVEHNMKVVMGICRRVVVLNFGQRIAEGSPNEVSKNEAVIQAYLGADYAA
jgi:branched-chain amino acid transport system ATP-binding protein